MGIESVPRGAGTSRIKKRIRDVSRLLKKPGLAATKKVEAERALAALQKELDGAKHRNVEKTYAQKYHMVRFFERKKALRALKKSDAGDDELAAWYYVTKYPKDQKYSAIFAQDAQPSNFLEQVRTQMKSGELASGADGRTEALKAARS